MTVVLSFCSFSFRPLIQNKLEVLGKAGLSEDVLEADCTFFKVLITFPKHESSPIL